MDNSVTYFAQLIALRIEYSCASEAGDEDTVRHMEMLLLGRD
jgi:hypothetical protein